jgi:hypothetical protein
MLDPGHLGSRFEKNRYYIGIVSCGSYAKIVFFVTASIFLKLSA